MAENLLIRKLPPPANTALKKYKKETNIDVNTKAACAMIREYWSLQERLQNAIRERDEMTLKYNQLRRAIERQQEAQHQITQIIQS